MQGRWNAVTTKERITEEALTLFAEKGYKGTSVKNIADAVGIKDASLYNHFRSKQEIFNSIVELILNHISELSQTLGIPQYDSEDAAVSDFFINLGSDGLKKITRESFLFYLTDPYNSGGLLIWSSIQILRFIICSGRYSWMMRSHIRKSFSGR